MIMRRSPENALRVCRHVSAYLQHIAGAASKCAAPCMCQIYMPDCAAMCRVALDAMIARSIPSLKATGGMPRAANVSKGMYNRPARRLTGKAVTAGRRCRGDQVLDEVPGECAAIAAERAQLNRIKAVHTGIAPVDICIAFGASFRLISGIFVFSSPAQLRNLYTSPAQKSAHQERILSYCLV